MQWLDADLDLSPGGPAGRARCRLEFMRPYVGGDTLPRLLEEYITNCATRAAAAPSRFQIPLVAIVQSSGSGKSRLMRELAHRTKADPDGPMRVLYTCVRPRSAGFSYPLATVYLCDYLFPRASRPVRTAGDLATKLLRLFDFASTHWTTVGHEWAALFDDQRDWSICTRLAKHVATAVDYLRGQILARPNFGAVS